LFNVLATSNVYIDEERTHIPGEERALLLWLPFWIVKLEATDSTETVVNIQRIAGDDLWKTSDSTVVFKAKAGV
jgi:hypothetical protein